MSADPRNDSARVKTTTNTFSGNRVTVSHNVHPSTPGGRRVHGTHTSIVDGKRYHLNNQTGKWEEMPQEAPESQSGQDSSSSTHTYTHVRGNQYTSVNNYPGLPPGFQWPNTPTSSSTWTTEPDKVVVVNDEDHDSDGPVTESPRTVSEEQMERLLRMARQLPRAFNATRRDWAEFDEAFANFDDVVAAAPSTSASRDSVPEAKPDSPRTKKMEICPDSSDDDW